MPDISESGHVTAAVETHKTLIPVFDSVHDVSWALSRNRLRTLELVLQPIASSVLAVINGP